jgi:AcrR family transcriptional regulator
MTKGEVTRQRIIAQAAPIFNQRGFAGVSMQDVMEATGLEKGGLYRHFTSKEELAVEAFRYALDRARETRLGGVSDIEGAIPQLRYAVHRFVRTPSPMPGGCPLMNTAIDADDSNPALRALAKEGIQSWKARLAHIVEDGMRSGEIRKGTRPRQIANLIVATLEGALMISRLEETRHALIDAEEALDELILGLSDRAVSRSAARSTGHSPATDRALKGTS